MRQVIIAAGNLVSLSVLSLTQICLIFIRHLFTSGLGTRAMPSTGKGCIMIDIIQVIIYPRPTQQFSRIKGAGNSSTGQRFKIKMSLLKIPLVLSSAAAMQVSLTSPNHSSSNEVVNHPLSERIMRRLLKYGLSFAKVHACSLIVTIPVYEPCPRDYIGSFLS